eukprot:TRINITY_DN113_c0_g1_i1.p2 TRINITY_DN113_c0_g1~~TRINITY_DN113_c0_g1_i1.p2  ORF type:complete len:148 (-),score=37.87 TRINITY_DN113_c0_g1_i1:25-468(-)
MPETALPSADDTLSTLTAFTWSPRPEPAQFVQRLLQECVAQSAFAARLAERMSTETGTRLLDWIDHFGLPEDDPALQELDGLGYTRADQHGVVAYEHRQGLFPRIRVHRGLARQVAIKVESVVDFLAEIGRAVQQECRDRSRMPSSA